MPDHSSDAVAAIFAARPPADAPADDLSAPVEDGGVSDAGASVLAGSDGAADAGASVSVVPDAVAAADVSRLVGPDKAADPDVSDTGTVAADTAGPATTNAGTADTGTADTGTDAPGTRADAPTASRRRHHRARRTDWRLGGSTVRRWREGIVAWALFSLGAGVLAAVAVSTFHPRPITPFVAMALLWAGMAVPIVLAFARSRPVRLLRIHPLDAVYAVVLGGALRLTQGWLEVALGGSGALPSYPRIGGHLPTGWWFTDLIAPVAIAPLLEEFFFRGVILVCVYAALRRALGGFSAGFTAVAVSSILFLAVHGIASPSLADLAAVGLLGVVCGSVVALTGRIWGAVLIHVVYNASFVVLALAGSAG